MGKVTGIRRIDGRSRTLMALLGSVFLLQTAEAQDPSVTFEFESMFGEKKPYVRCTQEQAPNGFCTLPPNQNPPEGFISPTGVDWLSATRLIIADRGNSKLQKCSDHGSCLWIGQDGAGGGQFSGRNFAGVFDLPHGVEVNPLGRIAVSDEDNQLVQYCDDTGGCVVSGETSNTNAGCQNGGGKWCEPHDAAFDSNGDIFVVDTGNDRIQALRLGANDFGTPQLGLRQIFGTKGSAVGEFNKPGGIAVDAQDRLVIADTDNHRIQICEVIGRGLNCEVMGSLGKAPGQFDTPTGIDVDDFGRIWIADTNNHRVQVCQVDGTCQAFGQFGDFDPKSDTSEGGPSEGPMRFNQPHDVAVSPEGRVAVVDTSNHRIQLFSTESKCGTSINPGMNDAWYDPDKIGQGFFFTVYPDIQKFFLAQFTYDLFRPEDGIEANLGDPGHRWLTALGDYCGLAAELDVTLTSGGRFDASDTVENQTGYGQYRIRFPDCATAILDYDLPEVGRVGNLELKRVVSDNIELCETLSGSSIE